MRRRSKVRMIAVLFLVTILLTGSVTVYLMANGILIALIIFIILCLLMLLIAAPHFGKKKVRALRA